MSALSDSAGTLDNINYLLTYITAKERRRIDVVRGQDSSMCDVTDWSFCVLEFHAVHCLLNPISCSTHPTGPLSARNSPNSDGHEAGKDQSCGIALLGLSLPSTASHHATDLQVFPHQLEL